MKCKTPKLLYGGLFIFMVVNIISLEFYFESKVHPMHPTASIGETDHIQRPSTVNKSNHKLASHGLNLIDDDSLKDTNPLNVKEYSNYKFKHPIYFLHIYKSGGTYNFLPFWFWFRLIYFILLFIFIYFALNNTYTYKCSLLIRFIRYFLLFHCSEL
jgi:hypothetical protein